MLSKKLSFLIFCFVFTSVFLPLCALSVNEKFIEACKEGRLEEACRLLDDGAYIETRDGSDHQTAIVWAASNGHLSIVSMLLERGANINAQDDKGWTALSEASYTGHINVVEFLLKNKASTLPSTGWVTETKHGNAVFWCVESAFNSYNEKIEIVKLLLKHNAEPEGMNHEKLDTLGIAKARNYKEIVDLLEKYAKERLKKLNEYGLLEAIKARDIKKVREYLGKKVNPNLLLPNGESILNRAVAMQNFEIVSLLVENGANPSTQNELGTSALMEAMRHNNLAISKFLLQHGANVNQEDNQGRNVLFYAVQNNDINMIIAILNVGVNIHARDNYGETPLLYAIRLGNMPAVELLLSKGADVSASDRTGNTALHIAAQKGRLDLVRLILRDSRVDPNATNNDDYTALHYARKNASTQVIKLLKRVTVEESDEEDENSAKSENDSNKNEAPKDED